MQPNPLLAIPVQEPPEITALRSELYKNKIMGSLTPIGSYFAFGAGRDMDAVLLVPQPELTSAAISLVELGFSPTQGDEGSGAGGDHFEAYRRDRWNILLTSTVKFAIDSRKAFEIVKLLNLREKQDRINVHKIIVDGYTCASLPS